MKIVKGSLFLLVIMTVASCFDPPEFPEAPHIEFDKAEFYDGQLTDSLVIYFNFQDGNGDLGLSSSNPDHVSYPFHNLNFFQAIGNGQVSPLVTYAATVEYNDGRTEVINILDIPSPEAGKLVFPRTRKQPTYGNLPAFDCQNYEYTIATNLYIEETDWAVADQFVKTTDTVYRQNSVGPPTKFYEILDTALVSVNPDHFNIEVDFLIRGSQGGNVIWTEYDWREEFCLTFDGRFPVLSDQGNALEGTLRYSMNSIGFIPIFGLNKTIKLRIQIKDRALNKSEILETREFTLDQILVR